MATLKLTGAPDCGNAPKKQVLRDYALSLIGRDLPAALAALSDDVVWDIAGRDPVDRDGIGEALDDLLGGTATTLQLDSVLTHGAEGAVSGVIALTGGRSIRFCDVYTFSGHSRSAKIKRITSYWV